MGTAAPPTATTHTALISNAATSATEPPDGTSTPVPRGPTLKGAQQSSHPHYLHPTPAAAAKPEARVLQGAPTRLEGPILSKLEARRRTVEEAEKEVTDRIDYFMNNDGTKSVDHFHKRLGKVMWDKVGMARNEQGLKEAMAEIKQIREEFWKDVKVPGSAKEMNPELEKAGRVADFLELGELFAKDALVREESCGGHFREESVELDGEQKGEAKRNDNDFAFVSAWEYKGEPADAVLHKEELEFKDIELKQRSYK